LAPEEPIEIEAYRIFLTDMDVSMNSLVFIVRSTIQFLSETCKRGLLWKFQTDVLLSMLLMLQIVSLAKMKEKILSGNKKLQKKKKLSKHIN